MTETSPRKPKPKSSEAGGEGTSANGQASRPKPAVADGPGPRPAQQPETASGPKAAPKPAPAAPKSGAAAADKPIPRPAPPARPRRRHWLVVLSFVVMVLLPSAGAGLYLWTRAADQYASYVGFSVRTEEVSSAIELLGGITQLSGSSSSDTDILYTFLQSQELVAKIDRELDLRAIWSKADPEVDPVFAYHPPGTIEDLTDYWGRMVKVYYDSASGLLDLRINAFTPEDATMVAEAIFRESSIMINALSAIAREDALRYAREELGDAVERLKEARREVTEFRNLHQIVDPEANIQGQVGLITTLQNQLAAALIELDMLAGNAGPNDPRVTQTQRRIEVIENRIEQERRKLGDNSATGSGGPEAYAKLVGEYESLAVDRQFAEESYRAALAAYDAAQAEARRQNRYLAAHVNPTRAERPEYPERFLLLGLIVLFLVLAWSIIVLVAYSLKDRR